jgi:hypothetical protein
MLPHFESFRQCFQFSLHTLLYVVTFACCATGVLYERNRRETEVAALSRESKEQLAAIESKHRLEWQWWKDNYASAGWDFKAIRSDRQRAVPLMFNASASQAEKYGVEKVDDETLVVSDDWTGGEVGLLHLCAFENVKRVHITHASLTSEGLIFLRQLPQLIELQLNLATADDRCFEHLAGLARVRVMQLNCPKFTDVGFAKLKGLRSLQHLILRCDQISDVAIADLQAGLPCLKIHRASAPAR